MAQSDDVRIWEELEWTIFPYILHRSVCQFSNFICVGNRLLSLVIFGLCRTTWQGHNYSILCNRDVPQWQWVPTAKAVLTEREHPLQPFPLHLPLETVAAAVDD